MEDLYARRVVGATILNHVEPLMKVRGVVSAKCKLPELRQEHVL
jgi:hypothetical protein